MTPRRPPRRVLVPMIVAVWLVYAATAGGHLATGDAVAMFEQGKAIVDRADMNVPASQSAEEWRGTDGRYYTPFGVGQSLYDIPWLLAGRAIAQAAGAGAGDPDRLPKALVAFGSTVTAAAAVAAGFLLAWLLSGSARASLVAAAALALGTSLWPYSKYGFNAPLAAAALCAGVYGIAAGTIGQSPAALILGGAALGAALLTRHELILGAAVAMAWMGVMLRGTPDAWRRIAAAGVGIGVALGVWSSLNFIRFGNPVWTGHAPGFSFAGLLGLTLSPAGSLALYAPPAMAGAALLPLARRRNAAAGLYLAVSGTLFIFYAALDDWRGTRSYGPRYLVPLLPLLVAPLAVLWGRAGKRLKWCLVAGCLASAAVQLPPVMVDFSRAGINAGQPPQSTGWRWAPLVVTAREAARSLPRNLEYFVGAARPPRGDLKSLDDRVGFSLDFWWLYLFYLGVLSRPLVVAVVLTMLGTAGWSFRRAWLASGMP